MRDNYWEVVKTAKIFESKKAVARRFVPGNTAFKVMSHLPVLTKEAMTKINFTDRELVFKGVVGSDKWTRVGIKGASSAAGPADSEEDEEDEEVDDKTAVVPIDSSSELVFFHMELHPRVQRNILFS